MATKTRPLALIRKCSDFTSPREHMMRDYCTTCAPYWDVVALCPVHRRKLNPDTGYCKDCRKYYDMAPYTAALTGADNETEPAVERLEAYDEG